MLTNGAADTAGMAALTGLVVLSIGAVALVVTGPDDVATTRPAADAPADAVQPVVDTAGVDVAEVPPPTGGPDDATTAPDPAPAAPSSAVAAVPSGGDVVAAVTEPARLVVEVTGDAAQTVVTVHNRGGSTSAPFTVSYEGLAGFGGDVRVLDTDGPVTSCQQWFCTFDGVEPGAAVAGAVFTVDTDRCLDVVGVGRVTLEAGGDVLHGDVPWCVPTDLVPDADDAVDGVDELVDDATDLVP